MLTNHVNVKIKIFKVQAMRASLKVFAITMRKRDILLTVFIGKCYFKDLL